MGTDVAGMVYGMDMGYGSRIQNDFTILYSVYLLYMCHVYSLPDYSI